MASLGASSTILALFCLLTPGPCPTPQDPPACGRHGEQSDVLSTPPSTGSSPGDKAAAVPSLAIASLEKSGAFYRFTSEFDGKILCCLGLSMA